MKLIKRGNAQVFLFINAVLWGSSYIWSKMLLGFLPRFSILLIAAVGGLIATVVMFYPALKGITKKTVFIGIAISGISILSNTFCMLALQKTSSSNTAFIVQMSVVITPVIMAVMNRKFPGVKIVICSLMALGGIFLLTCDINNITLNIGDLFALCNAFFFSLFIACLNFFSNKMNAVHFTFVHHGTNTVAFLILTMVFEMGAINLEILRNPTFIMLAVVNSAVIIATTLIQSTAIKFVRAEKATLIYTFEPVTAAVLAFFLMGERLNGMGAVVGSLIILLAVAISVIKPRNVNQKAMKGASSTMLYGK